MNINYNQIDKLDKIFLELGKVLLPLSYSKPTNLTEEETKFLETKKNPTFKYKPLGYDPEEIIHKVDLINKLIHTSNPELDNLYKKKASRVLEENRLITNIGNKDIIREITSQMYGEPSQKVIELATQILQKDPAQESEKNIPATTVKEALQNTITQYGLNWTVELSDKRETTNKPALKKMTVCETRLFSLAEIERLQVHEVGIHAIRGANGYAQPIQVFALGLPNYIQTEEGLASYFEEKTNNLDKNLMREYAGRVLAVQSIHEDADFKKTFEMLQDFKFTDKDSFTLSYRAHRAGGFLKDHIYLSGYLEVKEFAETGGNLKNLFVGKVGITDLPLVETLLENKVLKEPKYLPHFMK